MGSFLREFNNSLQTAGQPDSSAAANDATPGQVTLPETTVTVTPEQRDAYLKGFQDGKAGAPNNPIDRVGFALAVDYQSGYEDGQAAGQQEQQPQADDDGLTPEQRFGSIGPDDRSDEERAEDVKRLEDEEERRRELAKELGQTPPEEFEDHTPEVPELNIPEAPVGD